MLARVRVVAEITADSQLLHLISPAKRRFLLWKLCQEGLGWPLPKAIKRHKNVHPKGTSRGAFQTKLSTESSKALCFIDFLC